MTSPTTNDLQNRARFELLLTLDHQKVVDQIRPFLFRPSMLTITYWGLNILTFTFLVVIWWKANYSLINGFSIVCMGMLATWITLLPIHEHIHAFAYRSIGAKSVHVRYQIRTLTAQCVAPGFVTGSIPFAWVCLAPFLVLNTALLFGVLMLPNGPAKLFLAGGLLLHLGATSGDISLANILWIFRGRRLWTYDDDSLGSTFFFADCNR